MVRSSSGRGGAPWRCGRRREAGLRPAGRFWQKSVRYKPLTEEARLSEEDTGLARNRSQRYAWSVGPGHSSAQLQLRFKICGKRVDESRCKAASPGPRWELDPHTPRRIPLSEKREREREREEEARVAVYGGNPSAMRSGPKRLRYGAGSEQALRVCTRSVRFTLSCKCHYSCSGAVNATTA